MKIETIYRKTVEIIKLTQFNNDNFKILDVNYKNGWVIARSILDDHIEIQNAFTNQHEILNDLFCYEAIIYINKNYAATVI